MDTDDNEYAECISVAKEALVIATNDLTDFNEIEKLQQIQEKIQHLKEKQNKKGINSIENLEKQLEETKILEEKLLLKEETLNNQLDEAKVNLDQVSEECEKFQEKMREEAKEKEALKQLLDDITKKNSHSLPKAKHNVKIYSNISRIKWQLNGNTDDVKGYMLYKRDLQSFQFNSKQQSQYHICNSLWQLMEEDW